MLMAEPGQLVHIHGATTSGAACATLLERAGIPVQIADSGVVPSGLAVVSRGLIAELGLERSLLSRPADIIVDRKLTEDDALDADIGPKSVALVTRDEIVEALTGRIDRKAESSPDNRALSIDASEFRLGDPDLLAEGILPLAGATECILLDWGDEIVNRAMWMRLTGECLSDVNATASILTSHGQTTLILAVPVASVVETSISVVDVLARLLAHPSVKSELPGSEPRSAHARLIRSGEPVHHTLQGGVKVRIGAAAGLADPVVLDRELRSGMIVAEQVGRAIADGRLSLARLSRIARVWSSADALAPSS